MIKKHRGMVDGTAKLESITAHNENFLLRRNNHMSQPPLSLAQADTTSPPHKKSRLTIPEHFRPSHADLVFAVFKWLASDGHPYNVVTTPAFGKLLRGVSGDPDATPLSREKYNDLLDAEFSLFAKALLHLLQEEHQFAFGERFLTIIHDIWSNTSKSGIVGVSLAFIDHCWNWRHVALLTTVKNDGHDAATVSSLIQERLVQVYATDIVGTMAKFTISDTASAARKVANFFDDTQQSDCSMHILSLCIAYGLGMKDHTRTTTQVDRSTQTTRKVKSIVTDGGALPEGRQVILKLRQLNNYFSNGTHLEALAKIQAAMGLPALRPLVDVDVRIASTCKLMRRSLLNYVAYKSYFQTLEDGNAFDCITSSEWRLAAEMEGITLYLSDLALVEAQRETIVASYMLVFRKFAEVKLRAEAFSIYNFKIPRAWASDSSLPRSIQSKALISEQGKTCIARTAYAAARPSHEKLRARTGSRFGQPSQEIDVLLADAIVRLKDEHFRLLKAKTTTSDPTPSSMLTGVDPEDLAQAEMVPSIDNDCIFGAPVMPTSTQSVVETQLRAQSDSTVVRWLDHQEDWVSVAYHQHEGQLQTSEITKRLWLKRTNAVPERSGGPEKRTDVGICWNLIGLYELVDICAWFRDIGQTDFPVVGVMARLWLGKVSSTAFQERVFSSGGIVMSARRTRTDAARAEKQLLLKHNREENARLRSL